MPAVLIDRDHGYARIMAALKKLGRAEERSVVVGVRAEEDGELLTIAATHEFGSDDGVIPARPYLRPTLDANRDAYIDQLAQGIGEIVDGNAELAVGTGTALPVDDFGNGAAGRPSARSRGPELEP